MVFQPNASVSTLLPGIRQGQTFLRVQGQPQYRDWKCPIAQQEDHKVLDPVCCQQPLLEAPSQPAVGLLVRRSRATTDLLAWPVYIAFSHTCRSEVTGTMSSVGKHLEKPSKEERKVREGAQVGMQ